eukprot:CAMPEP_0168614146 /NCGR_PEP_ID=MMETSP0449_2-20121227/3820_1 /TAXON_ID=1082188 /ORGANISM="Strombidium rassoulzadegani, Strain ras09" /LENGTH=54 /DNA_ID=CAMNT_0008654809 /DNA_START=288 /DNA_END=452 /DNA_ORIENTATION=+
MNTEGSGAGKKAADQWMKSPGHRANMLKDKKQTAVACFTKDNRKIYCTQLFTSP